VGRAEQGLVIVVLHGLPQRGDPGRRVLEKEPHQLREAVGRGLEKLVQHAWVAKAQATSACSAS
jgi:hypothetical protein